jgi:hypothetical protein
METDRPTPPPTAPYDPLDPDQDPIPLPPDSNPEPEPVREPDQPQPITDPQPSEPTRLYDRLSACRARSGHVSRRRNAANPTAG